MGSAKKAAASFLLTAVAGIAFSQVLLSSPIEVRRADGSAVRYYLEAKDPAGPAPALLVILQGSDCNSVRNIKTIDRLKRAYPRADLLTVEKYGITEGLGYSDEPQRQDCPEDYLLHDNPEQRVSDLDSVIRALRSKYGYSKVIVLGGSEGSVVANMITARADYITATVLFGGGGRFFLDDVLHSMKYTASSQEELERNMDGFAQFSQYILSHGPYDLAMGNHGYSWWRGMLSIDQEELLMAIDTPVLIVQGGDDRSASPQKASEMAASLRANGKTNIDYRLYPGYSHSLNLSLGDSSSERVVDEIGAWLMEKTR